VKKEANPDKKFVIQVKGIPFQATANHVERLVVKKLKDAGVKDIPEPINSVLKVVVEKDKDGLSKGICYCSSVYRPAIIELIKLHKKTWIRFTMKTYLSGFAYDAELEEDYENEEDDTKVENWVNKNPDYELMVYRKKNKQERLQQK
jgi:hypothetical protein